MASKQQPKHNIIVGLDAAQNGEDEKSNLGYNPGGRVKKHCVLQDKRKLAKMELIFRFEQTSGSK